ncbi:hypothetical protein KAR91_42400 [Candidatus Pacearchaeota archaeon]|nr:hypothetical protein [Candidatus Pacearchaeota archaeon]
MGSYNVRGERVIDGDASALAALTLYDAGSPDTVRTLAANERIHITDVYIGFINKGMASDVELVVDSAAGSRYIVGGQISSGRHLSIHFKTPYICDAGMVPKFAGAAWSKTTCVIHGFVREA